MTPRCQIQHDLHRLSTRDPASDNLSCNTPHRELSGANRAHQPMRDEALEAVFQRHHQLLILFLDKALTTSQSYTSSHHTHVLRLPLQSHWQHVACSLSMPRPQHPSPICAVQITGILICYPRHQTFNQAASSHPIMLMLQGQRSVPVKHNISTCRDTLLLSPPTPQGNRGDPRPSTQGASATA